MAWTLSEAAFERAKQSIAGGVNSPVRSFHAVNAPPLVAARAEAAHLYDADGNPYIDYLMSWGAIVLGHAHPDVEDAIRAAVARGTGYGLLTEAECELAEIITSAFPSIERVRLVNSGTEAVMSAVRLARGYTRRDRVIIFEGGYHGHSDGFLAQAGSGLATFSIPRSAGVPSSFVRETLLAQYNDLDSVEALCRKHSDDIACILVEPVAGNMGVIPPEPGFLHGLRDLCDRVGALLVFDEVITGFRVAYGGAQRRFGVQADLITLGKIIGGGLPVGAFGGRRDIMERLAPLGDVYQAGTLAGNPVVAAAGVAVLRRLRQANPYPDLELRAACLADGLRAAASAADVPLQVNRVGSMLTCFFSANRVADYASARTCDVGAYGAFFRKMLEFGVLLPPSQFEAMFLSDGHTQDDVVRTVRAADRAMRRLHKQSGARPETRKKRPSGTLPKRRPQPARSGL